jgi:hypothetical protein
MNKESGKSSVKLVLAIAVITVFAVIGVRYAMDFFRRENIKNTQADLLLVKAKIEVLKGNYDMNSDENPLQGHLLTEIPEEINISEFLDKHVISEDEYGNYYVLDKRKFRKTSIERIR